MQLLKLILRDYLLTYLLFYSLTQINNIKQGTNNLFEVNIIIGEELVSNSISISNIEYKLKVILMNQI